MSRELDSQRIVLETALRIGLLVLLAFWCLAILRPFLQPIAWAAVIAVASQTPFQRLQRLLGGRAGAAATLLVLLALIMLIVPAAALTTNLVETTRGLADGLRRGQITIPQAPEAVASWPLVGPPLHALWQKTNANLGAVLGELAPQLRTAGAWLLSTLATAGVGLVKFLVSLFIAGVLLTHGERVSDAVHAVATRLSGTRGPDLVRLAAATVQSVTRGILGVAIVQSLLAGLGMLAVGVPGAGLWALLVLLVAVMQLPTLLVLLPVAAYVFSTASLGVAVGFAIWSTLVGLCDNVLKPLLMGRGSPVPIVVIFLGVIGGFLLEGIIGLFVGAVVLALGYTLLKEWLVEETAT